MYFPPCGGSGILSGCGFLFHNYDERVKSQEKALSIVNMHKRPQDHCAAPKEMLRAWYLGADFCALSTAASED